MAEVIGFRPRMTGQGREGPGASALAVRSLYSYAQLFQETFRSDPTLAVMEVAEEVRGLIAGLQAAIDRERDLWNSIPREIVYAVAIAVRFGMTASRFHSGIRFRGARREIAVWAISSYAYSRRDIDPDAEVARFNARRCEPPLSDKAVSRVLFLNDFSRAPR